MTEEEIFEHCKGMVGHAGMVTRGKLLAKYGHRRYWTDVFAPVTYKSSMDAGGFIRNEDGSITPG